MTLEEEKKLVAQKLIGWKLRKADEVIGAFSEKKQEFIDFYKNWNPQKDRNCWPGIWEKMSEKQREVYIDKLSLLVDGGLFLYWQLHTAEPDICWQALIKSLEGK